MLKSQAEFNSFEKLDVRVGTIMSATPASTKKPTYRMTIDFGPVIGTKVSCGAYTNYGASDLIGRQVVAVVNFAPKKMGPELSEALVLGVHDPNSSGTIFLTVHQPAPNGSEVF